MISIFDQSKRNARTFEGEGIRLSNELRSIPAHTSIGNNGQRIEIPARRGFDVETADFKTMVNWLADTRIPKSESLIAFVHRVMAVRYPNDYAQCKDKIQNRYKLESEMIQSNARNEVEWFGEVGFQNKNRLDGSRTNNASRIYENRQGEIRIVKK